METPFTTEQFFEIIEKYNVSVFPLQLIIMVLGIIAVLLLHSKYKNRNGLITGFLGLLWLWIGIAYHLSFFTTINKAAYAFGGLFILQGLFFFAELIRGKTEFQFTRDFKGYSGYFFILFGLIIYPLISYFMEGDFPGTIALGLPCPTTILTFGFLMLSAGKLSKYLLIIPSIWAVIGTGAAVNFDVYQDYVMFLAAIIADIYLIRQKKVDG